MPKPNVTRVQSATEWTASVLTCSMSFLSHAFASVSLWWRMNNVGRFVASSRKKRVQVLAAARLHRCPGLFEVLAALKEYRVACSEGTCAVSPSNAFQPDALDWLEPQEENAS